MAAGLVALLLVAAAGGWAARTVFAPAEPPEPIATSALVEVTEGDLGSALNVTASATWTLTPTGFNEAIGTVTAAPLTDGTTVDAGAELYRVDDRPVFAALGAVPAFRDLAVTSRGPDVAQVQDFLVAQEYLDAGSVDGVFGPGTAAAVRQWQRDVGLPATGDIVRSDLIFLPELPSRVRLAESVSRGERLSGGEPVIEVYSATPQFDVPLNAGQADLVTSDMAVVVRGPHGDWQAAIDQVDELDDGTLIARLVPTGGSPSVCGDQCSDVPVTGRTAFPASIELVPPVSGLLVPAGALVTSADGAYQVVARDGTRLDVLVQLQASGYAAVTGIEAGTLVRVPGE